MFCSWPLNFPRLCPADGPAGCGPGGWALVKAAASMLMFSAHVRREASLPTQLGVAWYIPKGDFMKPVKADLIGILNGNAP